MNNSTVSLVDPEGNRGGVIGHLNYKKKYPEHYIWFENIYQYLYNTVQRVLWLHIHKIRL